MRFDRFIPSAPLKQYISHYIIAENTGESQYKVLPTPGLVAGFQYQGQLSAFNNGVPTRLSSAGITGMMDSFRLFQNSAGTGSVLVYFTEAGLMHFTTCPANELFNHSIALDNIFSKDKIREAEEKLSFAHTDALRIHTIEQFLLAHLNELSPDKLILEAIRLIHQSQGTIKIKDLNQQLFISPSPFEKRFRKLVGTTPKKFAAIVRFNAVLRNIAGARSLTDIGYDHNFFDQAHFIKDFKRFTGATPEQFR